MVLNFFARGIDGGSIPKPEPNRNEERGNRKEQKVAAQFGFWSSAKNGNLRTNYSQQIPSVSVFHFCFADLPLPTWSASFLITTETVFTDLSISVIEISQTAGTQPAWLAGLHHRRIVQEGSSFVFLVSSSYSASAPPTSWPSPCLAALLPSSGNIDSSFPNLLPSPTANVVQVIVKFSGSMRPL